MFAEQLATAISNSPTLNNLDQLTRMIWQGHAAGAIADAEAQLLAEQIHHRRTATREAYKPVGLPPGRPSIFPPKRIQRSPDRAKSIERRRTLAASGPMPPALACRFTVGQLAVLRIVADEVRDNGGQCVKTIPEIAARAGVSRRLAQGALREAALQGLIVVQERRRRGRKNDPNIVRIVSVEWLTWIAKHRRGVGAKVCAPTDTRFSYRGRKAKFAATSAPRSPRPERGAHNNR